MRELENTIQRACVLATSDMLLPKDIPLGVADAGPSLPHQPLRRRRAVANRPREAAIEVLLRAAQIDPDVQLLPWLEREFTLHAMKATQGQPGPRRQAARHHPRHPAQTHRAFRDHQRADDLVGAWRPR